MLWRLTNRRIIIIIYYFGDDFTGHMTQPTA